MGIFKNTIKDSAKEAGAIIGNEMSRNAQNATNTAFEGMKLFQDRMNSSQIQNGQFEFYKGNLFEYIEAVKFNTRAASLGKNTRAVVTDAVGRPGDAADIEIMNGDKIAEKVQAKFSTSRHAAADSVHMQRKDKYKGMQRLIRKEDNYVDASTGEQTTLLNKVKSLAKNRSEVNDSLYKEQYKDVYENLTDELHYDDVSSGGTTLDELKKADENPLKYANNFEKKQMLNEMKASSVNMAKAGFVTGAISSGVINMFEVFNDKKELADALHDIGADTVKSTVRGAATGTISTAIRYKGIKAGSKLLSDSLASTVMASSLIDGGVSLYNYARGEIDFKTLSQNLVDTVAKSTTTVYFTKAVGAIAGKAVSPIIPLAIYTTASYVFTATRDIIKNANLKTEEYNRMIAIYNESTKQMEEYNKKVREYLNHVKSSQKLMLEEFINTFDYNIETGENYDKAIISITRFANAAGITLKNAEFNDFSKAINNNEIFYLE